MSDDNPYSEALFRTLKYRPAYPKGPFADLEAARRWVADFVDWYNHSHLHSAIRFVTPAASGCCFGPMGWYSGAFETGRGAGVADRAALEMLCAREGTVGSNPTLSGT